ncbi:MAG TPA: response regulator [Candidatus Saccharimonadales bacterium]|jgi:CheY-like chemotaxis protein
MHNTQLVLVVDDDPVLSGSMADALIDAGYDVETAADGQAGLTIALDKHPGLIFLDYDMPIMNGIDMLSRLRADEWGQRAQIIFATNSYDVAVINAVMAQGVKDYMLKSDTSLEQIVELARSRLVSP